MNPAQRPAMAMPLDAAAEATRPRLTEKRRRSGTEAGIR
jgi:hypothetical protein